MQLPAPGEVQQQIVGDIGAGSLQLTIIKETIRPTRRRKQEIKEEKEE